MSEAQTVLILGAGRGQMPIFHICKNLGYKVAFVTPEGDYPGIGEAEVHFADVRDSEAVTRIAEKVRPCAIITDQLDAGVYSCAYASDALGLIGIGKDVARRFTNKVTMRDEAVRAGVACPDYKAVHSLEEAKEVAQQFSFPLIMKPSDNASSRGIHMIDSLEELETFYAESSDYSTDSVVLLESYVKGQEYIVDSFTSNYEVNNLVIGKSDYFDIPKRFVPKGRIFRDASIADSHVEQKVLEANERLIKAFGLPFGITHGEFLYDATSDTVYLVEIAARGGGEFISGTIIPEASGVAANECMVKHALGLEYHIPKERKKAAAGYFSYMLPEGVIESIKGVEEVKNIPGVIEPFFDNIEVGMQNPPISDKASRKGPLIVGAPTREECMAIRQKIIDVLDIQTRTQSGPLQGIIWD